jgi:insulysin
LYPGFNEKELRETLAWLRPDNLLQVLMTPDVEAFRVSNYYAVPYTVRRGITDIFPIKPAVRQRFALPQPNPFLPEKLVVKSGSWLSDNAIKDKPELLVDKDATRIWYQQDHQYNRPYSGINLRLIVPPVQVTAERSALNYLFAAMMNDQLNDRIYFAHLAGISFSIQPHSRGMDLRIFGFSNRQSLLINHTIGSLNDPQFTLAQFDRIKNRLLRLLQNQQKDSPYIQLTGNLSSLLMSPEWTASELATALAGIEYPQLLQFSRQFLWDAHIEGLIYGNYLPQEAMKLSAIVEHGLQSRQTGRAVSDLVLRSIPLDQSKPELHRYDFNHQDKLLALYLQAPSASADDAASMILLRQILQPAFFQQLRTEQQSGYLVSILPLSLLKVEGSLLLVQSPDVSEAELQQRVDKFLDAQTPLIKRSFAQYQSSLITSLQQPARSISEQNNRYWHSILIGDTDFTYQDNLLRAVQSLQPDALIAYYRLVFQNKNRRMWLSTADIPVDDTAQP